jgi:hypothetical protein
MPNDNRWEKYKRVFSDLTIDQKTGLIIFIISVLVAVGLAWLTGVLDERYAGFALSVALAFIAMVIPLCHAVNRLNDHFDGDGGEGLKYIGNSREGLVWLLSHLLGLTSVINTVFRPIESFRSLEDAYRSFFDAIRKALAGGTQWYDLVVPCGDVATMPVSDFYETLTPAERLGYEAKMLTGIDHVPLMQITVLKFADGRSAVSVGFGYPGADEQMVYVSYGPKTVRFYERYLQRLYYGPHAQMLYQRPAPKTVSRRRRWWFRYRQSDTQRAQLVQRAGRGEFYARLKKFVLSILF